VKFKLDENLGSLGRQLLTDAGHDVSTVNEQQLSGASDKGLYGVCVQEHRVLITLDRDFGHALRFPPETTAGIVAAIAGSAYPEFPAGKAARVHRCA